MSSDMMIACSAEVQMLRDLKRLERHFEQRRRQLLLATIEHHYNSRTAAKQLWSKLKPAEQEDPEIVYKFLSCTDLFGTNPWQHSQFNDAVFGSVFGIILSESFSSDPLAAMAFFANSNRSFSPRISFPVPHCMRSNKQVMMAVCAKYPRTFKVASPELRDDEDLVRTALAIEEEEFDQNIGHVSERLRKDTNTLLYAVTMGYCTLFLVKAWVQSLPIEQMDITAQKQIGWVLLRYFSINPYDYRWSHENTILVVSLKRFLPKLRDDKDFMLPFVKLDCSTLQCCSDRLRSDTTEGLVGAAISQNNNAYHYVNDPIILEEYNRKRQSVDFVRDELENKGLFFCNVPQDLKANKVIILAALKAGNSDLDFRCAYDGGDDYLQPYKHDKNFILDVIAASPQHIQSGCFQYNSLPEHLQADEDIAKALVAAGYPTRSAILAKLPSLLHSRETMMSAVAPNHHKALGSGLLVQTDWQFADLVGQSDFCDDPEFMLKACKCDRATFEKASERIRSDPDFVRAVLAIGHDVSFITATTGIFQVNHPNLIVEAIYRGLDQRWTEEWDQDWWSRLNPGVWRDKTVIMSCLQKGRPILEHLASNSPQPQEIMLHLSDKEVLRLAVQNNPADFQYASEALRQDGEFVLSLVNEIDRVLHHAPAAMKYDKDILVAAMARSAGTISDCFDSCFELGNDFEFLCDFSSKLRSAILLYRRVSCLDMGTETEAAFRDKIAEYANIPLGTGVESLQAALANMKKFGF